MAHRLPYLLGFTFTFLSFVLCVIGFGTGHWWVTTDSESWFGSAGLWQICFNGYQHTSDLIGKAYYGCWWIFYREYYYIRDWIMPRTLYTRFIRFIIQPRLPVHTLLYPFLWRLPKFDEYIVYGLAIFFLC